MNKKLVMVTSYDYPTAKILERVGVDYILVGDSLGMVVLGYQSTKNVTLSDMLHHTRAVARGVKNTTIISDLPIGTYETVKDAIVNAKQLLANGAGMVKIEGNKSEIVKAMRKQAIRVCGHLGLLPQSATQFRVQGREEQDAQIILNDARELENAGVELIVLECVPQDLGRKIAQECTVPVIGIGAGKDCDGQVLVLHDLIGLSDFQGKFVRQYADVKQEIFEAVKSFTQDVRSGMYPSEKESYV